MMDTAILPQVNLSNPTIIKHRCPATNISYSGNCPNVKCPANTKGNCFIQQRKTSLIDLSYSLQLTTHETRRQYASGIKIGHKFIIFYQWLQLQRENSTIARGCSQCGVPTINNLDCLAKKRCKRRQKFIKAMRQRYPMQLTPLKMQANEFWATVLAQNQEKLTIISPRHLHRANKLLARLNLTNGVNHAHHH